MHSTTNQTLRDHRPGYPTSASCTNPEVPCPTADYSVGNIHKITDPTVQQGRMWRNVAGEEGESVAAPARLQQRQRHSGKEAAAADGHVGGGGCGGTAAGLCAEGRGAAPQRGPEPPAAAGQPGGGGVSHGVASLPQGGILEEGVTSLLSLWVKCSVFGSDSLLRLAAGQRVPTVNRSVKMTQHNRSRHPTNPLSTPSYFALVVSQKCLHCCVLT